MTTKTEIEDELTDAQFKPRTQPQAVTGTATAASQPPTITQDEADDIVDLVRDSNLLKVKPVLPTVLPAEPGKAARICVLEGKAYRKLVHFIAGVGTNKKGLTILCLGRDCPECQRGSDHAPRAKVVTLAIRYETSSDCKFAKGTTKPVVSLGFINFSPTAFTEVNDLPSENETIYDIDIKAVRKASGLGWTFSRMSSPPAFIKAEMTAEVAELVAPYADGVILKSRLGKVVSLVEMKALLSGRAGAPDLSANASLDGIEDLN